MENNKSNQNNKELLARPYTPKAPARTHIVHPKKQDKKAEKPKTEQKHKIYARRRPSVRKHSNNLPVKAANNNRSFYKPTLAEKLVRTLTSLIGKSLKTLIPWVILSTALFATGAYYVFHYATAAREFPLWYTILLALFIFVVYATFGLIYGIAMALLYIIKMFSENIGGLIREAVNRTKNSIESKIDNIADTVSRTEVADVIKKTFAELSGNIRKYAARTAAGIIAIAALGGILFLTKNMLLRSVSKIKNKADFFTLLSARATLFLAVILNLSFFAKLAICAGYLIGLIVILTQVLTIVLVK